VKGVDHAVARLSPRESQSTLRFGRRWSEGEEYGVRERRKF
jgi:hypothetical protein